MTTQDGRVERHQACVLSSTASAALRFVGAARFWCAVHVVQQLHHSLSQ
jgi:hypothetical protein